MTKFQEIERILKAAKEKQEVTYKGAPIRSAADFSRETLQVRRDWQEIFQVMENTCNQDHSTQQGSELKQKAK